MKPIDFPQSTKVLQKPSTMTDKECASLHVWSDGNQCVSCWKPTFKERLSILFGGKVWLGVLSGKTQPPVFVSGTRVFNKTPFREHCGTLFSSLVGCVTEIARAVARATKQAYKRVYFYNGFVIALFAGLLVAPLYGLLLGMGLGLINAFFDYEDLTDILDFTLILVGAIVGALAAVFLMRLLEVVLPSVLM